jgi:hypothetical protein
MSRDGGVLSGLQWRDLHANPVVEPFAFFATISQWQAVPYLNVPGSQEIIPSG